MVDKSQKIDAAQSEGVELLWQTGLDQKIIQSPLVIGEMVLVATQQVGQRGKHSTLQALNLKDGTICWQHSFDYALIIGQQAYRMLAEQQNIAVVTTGSTHLLRGQGGVYAFDQAGEIIWQWQGEDQHYSAPVVMDRQVLLVAGANKLTIISPEAEGDVERHIPLDVNASVAAPVVHQGIVYIPCRSPELLALDLNGTVRWHFQFETDKRDWFDKTPLVTDETVYVVSRLGKIIALETSTGNLVWLAAIGNGRSLTQPVFADDRLYVGMRNGLTVLDARNGLSLWTFETPRPVSTTPLIFHDTLYMSCEDHFLYALDLESGKELWRWKMDRRIEMSPALAPNALLVADRGGTVVALQRPSVPETTPVQPFDSQIILVQNIKTAVAHAENGRHQHAAELWHQLGELEQAALQYELAGKWLEAANLWLQIDRFGKRANAYERHAHALSKQDVPDEEKAIAWEQAARAYVETGQKDERLKCEREVARFRRQPIIMLAIEPEALSKNAWSKINYTVSNNGFGIARFVTVILKGNQFDGKPGRTKSTPTIIPGKQFKHWLDVSPRRQGTRVPLQVTVEYTDKSNQLHKLERTFSLEVAAETIQTTPSDPQVDSGFELAQLPNVGNINLLELRIKIIQLFGVDELQGICLGLAIDPDTFAPRKNKFVDELILYLVRRNQLDELIGILRIERPNVKW